MYAAASSWPGGGEEGYHHASKTCKVFGKAEHDIYYLSGLVASSENQS